MVFNRKNKQDNILDSGFSANPKFEGSRLINKDGSSNVRKKGLTFLQRFSLFHTLINMNWLIFFLWLFIGYLSANVIFASVYLILGINGIQGAQELAVNSPFLKAFYFSAQTITTVGYGQLSPITPGISFVAAIESFVGLLGFAMATGLLYGRFSKPKARLIFSENALVSPYRDNSRGLMLRLANAKDSQMIDANASVFFSHRTLDPEDDRRVFYTLDLEISKINILATSWTIVHPLDDKSPLKDMTLEDFKKTDAELLIQIQAFDVTYNQPVNTRTSYKPHEFIWGAKFERILGAAEDGKATIQLGKLSAYNRAELPKS